MLLFSWSKTCVFTDSKVVLSWLAKPPSTWTIFVCNRVDKISEVLPFETWSYLNSSQNLADLATRGISVNKFLKSTLWCKGPSFLLTNFSTISVSDDVKLEKLKVKQMCYVTVIPGFDNFSLNIQKFLSFSKTVRVLAFVIRFFVNCCCSMSICKTRSRKINLVVPPLVTEKVLIDESR